MLVMGIDLGTSSVKVSVIETDTLTTIASASFPEIESQISSPQSGWAEQDPEMWWYNVKQSIIKCNTSSRYNSLEIKAIGISYQMHGLVVIDKNFKVLRPSIIWCDSRAVTIGDKAFDKIGKDKCLSHLLNSPGNFTASKLAWVKEKEPDFYKDIYKAMLPGDFIAMKLSNQISTTVEALSEGIFWDFKNKEISKDVLKHFQISEHLLPSLKGVFDILGYLDSMIAKEIGLSPKTLISYKAGDQPNNALSLNVLKPGEIAATAGTSGVIYGVSDKLTYDHQSRVNTFAHVNYTPENNKVGVLLCINGVGIMNRWIRNSTAPNMSYSEMNKVIGTIPIGTEGLRVLPFGNGAERMLNNKIVGAHFHNINLNKHTNAHLYRGVQEGIAYSFKYGLDIMRENGMDPSVIRAGRANMFLSEPFIDAFVNITNTPVELYDCDGSVGAAIGAGIGSGIFTSAKQAFSNFKPLEIIQPDGGNKYDTFYEEWKALLNNHL